MLPLLGPLDILVAQNQSPQTKLVKSFEMNELGKQLLWAGIRHQHPQLNPDQINDKIKRRLDLYHNKNY